jgi:hypothetical protein
VKPHRLGAGALLCASTALAEPPARWSVGVERLFGVSHTWSSVDAGGPSLTTTSVGIGLAYLDHPGYDTPRIGADYLFELGLTLGTALGYATFEIDYEERNVTQDYWVVAPRVGWRLQPQPSLMIWPRAGLTLLMPGRLPSGDQAAVTLEVPVFWLLPGTPIGLSATPHLDLGFSPGRDAFFGLVSTEGKVSELGLSFGASVFF